MSGKNICKFIKIVADGNLSVTRFILENSPPRGKYVTERSDRVMLVLSGNGSYTVAGKSYPLSFGTLLFIFAGQSYLIEYEKELTYMYVNYRGTRTSMLYDRFAISQSNFCFYKMEQLIPNWRASLVSADNENIDLLSESVLLFTFSRLSGGKVEEDGAIRAVTNYIADNFSESSLTLGSMARDLGYSAKYLSGLISKKLGVCFSEYVKDMRMKNAIMLVEEGITSIKNIAVRSGYSNPLYFSRVFK